MQQSQRQLSKNSLSSHLNKSQHKNMSMRATNLLFASQTSCRVLMIGIVLSVLHTAGILVSAYLMTDRILEPDLPEKPVFHVCTEALFCPFYRILTGLSGITVQLIGSSKLLEIFVHSNSKRNNCHFSCWTFDQFKSCIWCILCHVLRFGCVADCLCCQHKRLFCSFWNSHQYFGEAT